MKRKNIDAAREFRLWISQVIVPGAIIAGAILSNPEVKEFAYTKMKSANETIKNRFKKRGT